VLDLFNTTIDKAPRPLRVGVHAAINSASRLSSRVRRRGEGFGLCTPTLVAGALSSLADGLVSAGSLRQGPAVVELGPGRTPHIAAAFALCGASSVSSFDVESMLDDTSRGTAQYRELALDLAEGRCSGFRIAMGCLPAVPLERVQNSTPLPITFRGYDGQHLPVTDGSIDIVTSRSVLEHVRGRLLPGLLRELHRALRPGGVMVHLIDLRDHMRVRPGHQTSGDWLDGLRYTEREYDAMFSHRPVYVNRLRSSQWKTIMETAGFEIVRWNPTTHPLDLQFERSDLQPPWNEYSEDELGIAFIACTLRKPAV
jgi:SAM-dependent methyltransferase